MSEFPWFASYPQGVPHEIDPDVYPNLSAVLDESAKKFPNHVGYTNLGADATYAQMKGYAESFAAYLQSLPDMKPGDRIALMMPNLLQYTVSPNAAPPSAATFRALHGMARWAYQFHPLKSLSVATDSVIWVSALKGQIRPNTRVKFACAARKLCAATGKSLKKPPL